MREKKLDIVYFSTTLKMEGNTVVSNSLLAFYQK